MNYIFDSCGLGYEYVIDLLFTIKYTFFSIVSTRYFNKIHKLVKLIFRTMGNRIHESLNKMQVKKSIPKKSDLENSQGVGQPICFFRSFFLSKLRNYFQ